MRGKRVLGLSLGLVVGLCSAVSVQAYECSAGDMFHKLVNTEHRVEQGFVPEALMMPNVAFWNEGDMDKNYVNATVGEALERLFLGAKENGLDLFAVSGYRSYERQSVLYNNAVAKYGVNQKGSAKAGASEHQTGYAMDIGGKHGYLLEQGFGDTPEGLWLAENSHKYGFIIRYPKGKEHLTGIMYEPWHLRYVGEDLAYYCYSNNLVLEELTHCCYSVDTTDITIIGVDGLYHGVLDYSVFNGKKYLLLDDVKNIEDKIGNTGVIRLPYSSNLSLGLSLGLNNHILIWINGVGLQEVEEFNGKEYVALTDCIQGFKLDGRMIVNRYIKQ